MRSPAERLALFLVLAACRGPAGTTSHALSVGGSTSSGSTNGATTEADADATPTTEVSNASETTAADTGTSDGTSPWRTDLPPPDLGPVDSAPLWCIAHKVDFIFFIQSYPEMSAFQSSIIASLPGFADAIEELFAHIDFHVMVVDGYKWGSPESCGPVECQAELGCGAINEPLYPCWAAPGDTCDNEVGAGEIFPAGKGASNKPCGVPDGRRYLTAGDPDFAETFACIGQVGYSGEVSDDNEYMEAVGHAMTGPNGCNAGFLRDDALLFMVLIGGGGYPQYYPEAWANFVKAAKGNDPDAIFALGLLQPYASSNDFVGEFAHHRFGDLNAPSFVAEFRDAAEEVLMLCDPPAE